MARETTGSSQGLGALSQLFLLIAFCEVFLICRRRLSLTDVVELEDRSLELRPEEQRPQKTDGSGANEQVQERAATGEFLENPTFLPVLKKPNPFREGVHFQLRSTTPAPVPDESPVAKEEDNRVSEPAQAEGKRRRRRRRQKETKENAEPLPPQEAAVSDEETTDSERGDSDKKDDGECPTELSDFSSKAVMTKGGWKVDVDDASYGSVFVGWKGGMDAGALKTKFSASGTGILIFGNDHADGSSANAVKVSLSGMHLLTAKASEERFLCFQFQKGDTLKISEVYGKIKLRKFIVDCEPTGQETSSRSTAASPVPASNITCDENLQIWKLVPGGGCQLARHHYHALLELKLSETKGLVQVYGLQGNEAVRRIADLPGDGAASLKPGAVVSVYFSHCEDPKEEKAAGLVVVADTQHAESYLEQIQTLWCYSARHNYDMWMVDVRLWRACKKFEKQFFFQKHCAISEFLGRRKPGYAAIVLDGDNVAAVMERDMAPWIDFGADIQLYERAAAAEIAAGNYIAKNTAFARKWLMDWALRYDKIPKGYSSADNGAVHLHLLDTLELKSREPCQRKYDKLVAPVTNLGPYFDFVHCVKSLLGRPRHWQVPGGSSLVIWPKFHFFVADGFYLNNQGSTQGGPVLHHGYKTRSWEPGAVHRTYFKDLGHCQLDSRRLTSVQTLARMATQYCDHQMKQCINRFTCKPLESDAEPERPRDCGKCA
eukprot:TRINITY_DN29534_c0_g1_i1.p1 TRINITY_DN29534_c0_g1~~TRINITY_DN29534_c0_g1_i1.p1  ORF type:complete len:717 (+),score=143.63 TRINITY_DN29534_c0_g1_i1:159-2309(+)